MIKLAFDEGICKIKSNRVPQAVAVVCINQQLIRPARQILPFAKTSQLKWLACNYLLDLRIKTEPYKSAPLRQLTGGWGECLCGEDSDRVRDQDIAKLQFRKPLWPAVAVIIAVRDDFCLLYLRSNASTCHLVLSLKTLGTIPLLFILDLKRSF